MQFTTSCRYDLGAGDQADTNKLFGRTFGFASNSARWGWKSSGSDSNLVALVPYIHEAWKIHRPPTQKKILVAIGETHELEVRRTSEWTVAFFIDGERVATHLFRKPLSNWGYIQYPYFGGNQTAPHDIRIHLDLI